MTPRTDIASLSLGPVRVTLSYLAEYNNLSRSEYVRRLLMREENRVLDAEARRKRAERARKTSRTGIRLVSGKAREQSAG